MKTMQGCTVVGYNVDSGKEVFTWRHVAPKNYDGTGGLPNAGRILEHNGKSYRVIGVRQGSTETLWEIDVPEERSK